MGFVFIKKNSLQWQRIYEIYFYMAALPPSVIDTTDHVTATGTKQSLSYINQFNIVAV